MCRTPMIMGNMNGHVKLQLKPLMAVYTWPVIPSTVFNPMHIGVDICCATCSLSKAGGKCTFFSKKSLQDFPVATAAIM